MRGCADFRAQMVAYVRDELLPLERAHVETHVARCRSCALLEKKVALAYEAVNGYRPPSEAEHLARLKKRLSPYVTNARPPRPTYLPIGVLAMSAAALIAGLVIFRPGTPAERPLAPQEVAINEHLHVI